MHVDLPLWRRSWGHRPPRRRHRGRDLRGPSPEDTTDLPGHGPGNQALALTIYGTGASGCDRATLLLNMSCNDMGRAVADAVSGSAEVLEIAAGTGLVTREVAPVVDRHVATNQSPEMLEVLRGASTARTTRRSASPTPYTSTSRMASSMWS